MNKFHKPSFEELNDYYKSYWKYLKEEDLLEAIKEQGIQSVQWLESLPKGTEDIAYAEGKWMVKEVVGHLCDTERILTYRALCFSRNDKTELPAFDENTYVSDSNFRDRKFGDIIDEFKTVRAATISLFSSMTEEMADRKGKANKNIITPRILLYFILVHMRHHLNVIKERYLVLNKV